MGFIASLAAGAVFVTASIGIVLGIFVLTRRWLQPGVADDRTDDLASTVAFRIAALHGLILGLVYAQELDDYKGVRAGLTEEAVAVADVFNDAARYGGPNMNEVQAGLAGYVRIVVDEEWTQLGRGEGLSADAWIAWDRVYRRLLDLEPTTDRHRFLADRMRSRITEVAKLRQMREATAMGRFSTLFWGPAIIGLVLLAVPFFVYRPTRTHVVLMALFGAYSGVILFFIFSFSNPFREPGRLEPAPFENLLRGDVGTKLPPP